jgi:flavin reductase (DIM6/NTAB) family NADH-FMN oxidoreductase RutF
MNASAPSSPPAGAATAPIAGSSCDPRQFRDALGCFGTGVTVVTTRDDEGRLYGVTASSFNSVSLSPPMVLWSLSLNAPSNAVFRKAPLFVVNVLNGHQEDIASRFSRAHPDKFSGIAHTLTDEGLPVIDGAAAHFLCRNDHLAYGGDHNVFIATVLRFSHEPETEPLFYWRGRFLRPV